MVTLLAAMRVVLGAIDPADFVEDVDNTYFPLVTGTTWVYQGETEGVPSSNVTTVTHHRLTILGVSCVIVHDQAFEDGELIEDTLDYYAQDVRGNVWYFGEDTFEYEDGVVVSTAGTWRAGVDGAQPGVIMEAAPKVGDRYAQETAPGVAEDMAKVRRLDESLCVAAGCFDGVLVTREWTPLERAVYEDKWYAPGVGMIFVEMVVGGDEWSELVSVSYR